MTAASRRTSWVFATALTCLTLGAVVASAGPIVGSQCGLGTPVVATPGESDERVYLTPILRRQGISCPNARRVAGAAMRRLGDTRVFCGRTDRYDGWAVKHVGAAEYGPLHARFVKGTRRFDVQSQGSC